MSVPVLLWSFFVMLLASSMILVLLWDPTEINLLEEFIYILMIA